MSPHYGKKFVKIIFFQDKYTCTKTALDFRISNNNQKKKKNCCVTGKYLCYTPAVPSACLTIVPSQNYNIQCSIPLYVAIPYYLDL